MISNKEIQLFTRAIKFKNDTMWHQCQGILSLTTSILHIFFGGTRHIVDRHFFMFKDILIYLEAKRWI